MGTYRVIAENYALWQKSVDPGAFGTREEFDAMSIEERIEFIEKCFGPESEESE
jgi:hypothetical protein